MALATYSELQAEVEAHRRRTDESTRIQSWVRQVELEAGRELKLRAQQQIATGTLAGGSSVIETPAGILYPQQLKFDGQPPINVDTVTLPQGEEIAYLESGRATPQHATVWGVTSDYKTQIRVWPAPSGDADYTLYYTSGITPLTAVAPVNYLLLVAADLYLFGVLYHGAKYDRDEEGAAFWRGDYDKALAQVRKVEWRARMPGRTHVRPRFATP